MSKVNSLTLLLTQLEENLKSASLWSTEQPSEQALASQQPFAVDTLKFEQWLQFIFIPKLTILIENSMPLPVKLKLYPMAEEAFKTANQHNSNLLNTIKTIDELFRN